MRTPRERRALDRLADAAAEVASVIGGPDYPLALEEVLGGEALRALAALYGANDFWQEAQLEAGEKRPKRKAIRPCSLKAQKSKRDETAEIRAAVFARAKGLCECGCGAPLGLDSAPFPPSLDHFFGRGHVKQAVENCWALAFGCDRGKTANYPSARFWLEKFALHCDCHGYLAEAAKARARIDGMVAVRDSERSRLSADEGRKP